MMRWLTRHSEAVQAMGALLTAVIAVIALVAVKYQVDAAARLQREQSARDIYREFLSLSVANPDLAAPDFCPITTGPREASYYAYFDYMLYAAEQSLSLDPGLSVNFAHYLQNHPDALCGLTDAQLDLYEANVAQLIRDTRPAPCPPALVCAVDPAGASD